MNFTLTDLKDLLLCTQDNNLQSISIKKKNFELIINKELIKADYINTPIYTEINRSNQSLSKKVKKTSPKNLHVSTDKRETVKDAEIYFTIVSPMVGTFYRSPAPNEAAFVKINDKVKVNQTVCIVEAMKLMNEIEAEVSGEVVEILVKDGDIIDCGQALMKIKPEE